MSLLESLDSLERLEVVSRLFQQEMNRRSEQFVRDVIVAMNASTEYRRPQIPIPDVRLDLSAYVPDRLR
jgi:hypothetical protein